MSTILEVLKKAQEEGRRKPAPSRAPGDLFDDDEPPRRRRSRGPFWIVVAVFVLGLGLFAGFVLGGRRSAPPGVPGGATVAGAPPAAAPVAAPAPVATAEPPAALPEVVAKAEEAAAPAAVPAAPTAEPVRPAAPARPAARAVAPPAPRFEPPAAVGEVRPAPYLEPQIGPGGVTGPPKLRTIPRPGGMAPPSGGFRDEAEVRIGPSDPPRRAIERPAHTAPQVGESLAADSVGPDMADVSDTENPEDEPGAALAGSLRAERERRAALAGEDSPADAAPGAPPGTAVASAPPSSAGAGDPMARALRHSPNGLPNVTINLVQWSAAPDRRFAFVRVDGSNMTQVREGDQIGGLTVVRIMQQAIEFGHGDSSFVLRTN